MHISCCENPRYAGLIGFRFCLYVGSCSCCNLKCIGHIFLASKETSCDQYQVCRDHFFRPLYWNHHHTACFGILLAFQLYDPGLADISVFIFDKLSNGCLVNPGVMSKYCNSLFLAVIGFQNLRPLRPRVGRCSCYRRLWHHLKLCYGFCTKTDGSSHTVISGITTADYQHMFASCLFIGSFGEIAVQKSFGDFFQEVYCKINSPCISSRHFNITGIGSSAAKDYTVKFLQKLLCCNIHSNICICYKFHTLSFHQLQPSVDHRFLQFHIWNAVTKKSADPVTSFEYSYIVTSSV